LILKLPACRLHRKANGLDEFSKRVHYAFYGTLHAGWIAVDQEIRNNLPRRVAISKIKERLERLHSQSKKEGIPSKVGAICLDAEHNNMKELGGGSAYR
jgi:hypothetical protein